MNNNINIFSLLRGENSDKKLFGNLIGKKELSKHNIIKYYLERDNKNLSFKDLLLGLNNYEHEKRSAIYELPTFELVLSLFNIAKFFNLKYFNEPFAGTGLLGKAIINHNEIDNYFEEIIISDGLYQYETCGYSFTEVTENDFLDFSTKSTIRVPELANVYKNNTLFVFSWPKFESENSLLNFLQFVNPICLVLIGDGMKINIPSRYSMKKVYCKQLCYQDNENIFNHSHLMIIYKNEFQFNENIIEEYLKEEKFEKNYSSIVNDMISDKKLFKNILSDERDEERIEFICKNILKIMMEYDIKKCPEYFEKSEDFYKYLNLCGYYKCKIRFQSLEKFKECLIFINKYKNSTIEEFNEAISNGIFPRWLKYDNIDSFIIDQYSINNINTNIVHQIVDLYINSQS